MRERNAVTDGEMMCEGWNNKKEILMHMCWSLSCAFSQKERPLSRHETCRAATNSKKNAPQAPWHREKRHTF